MGTSKVIHDFSVGRYTDLELSNKTSHVVEEMTDNPHFTTPSPPLADISEVNGAYIQSLNKVEGGSKEDTVIKNNYRKMVETLLKREADYVQTTSEGDEAIILSSGFDVNKKPAMVGPLDKATGLQITPGSNKGSIMANCNVLSNADFYEFEYTEAPIAPNCIWIVKTSTKHKILIEGLTSGKQYVFRVAGAGSDPSRNWSDEISSFVL
jgi:hypothetical protein